MAGLLGYDHFRLQVSSCIPGIDIEMPDGTYRHYDIPEDPIRAENERQLQKFGRDLQAAGTSVTNAVEEMFFQTIDVTTAIIFDPDGVNLNVILQVQTNTTNIESLTSASELFVDGRGNGSAGLLASWTDANTITNSTVSVTSVQSCLTDYVEGRGNGQANELAYWSGINGITASGIAYTDVVTLNGNQVLTTKTIDATSNTIANIGSGQVIADVITGQAAVSASGTDYILLSSSGALKKALVSSLPTGSVYVGTAASQWSSASVQVTPSGGGSAVTVVLPSKERKDPNVNVGDTVVYAESGGSYYALEANYDKEIGDYDVTSKTTAPKGWDFVTDADGKFIYVDNDATGAIKAATATGLAGLTGTNSASTGVTVNSHINHVHTSPATGSDLGDYTTSGSVFSSDTGLGKDFDDGGTDFLDHTVSDPTHYHGVDDHSHSDSGEPAGFKLALIVRKDNSESGYPSSVGSMSHGMSVDDYTVNAGADTWDDWITDHYA